MEKNQPLREPIIAGNWKMNTTVHESIRLVTELKTRLINIKDVEVVVAPPFTSLHSVAIAVQDSEIKVSAQNLFWEEDGAYTGEISGSMLSDLGCEYVIIGHSERRQHFEETNETVRKRIMTALHFKLKPILCIGETLGEREKNQTLQVLETQLKEGLRGIDRRELETMVVAYEPVWAIGTGVTASPEQAQEAHAFIRQWLTAHLGKENGERIRIQYGGSVKPDNIKKLMEQTDVDGALVGGASLVASSFKPFIGKVRFSNKWTT